ncbi:MAG TPA: bifunctional phosphoribosylaminoimidazolecarboxamide formyltransferase/IMP cyclohydrolase [Solirubrobacteraceae bacterium]
MRRALLSVSDKRGIVDFAKGLAELGIEVVSTGGTARELEGAGIAVRSIDDLTGFPEIMDGRVKTLHPKLYAGLLAVRDNAEHLQAAADHDIEFVDLVCVNLYPFERTAARLGSDDAEIIENIDIGGPTMIRAAAKNHAFSAVVVHPESYDAVLGELREADVTLSMATREALAAEAFAYTARYDIAISRWFAEKSQDFPPLHVRAYEKVLDLPYGENPHQRAAFYAQVGSRAHVLSQVQQHQGKSISFNNVLDLDAARAVVRDFDAPACAIVKHNNPCGVAVGSGVLDAYRRALECDPLSAYGGVVVLNRRVDREAAAAIVDQFVEVLFAPGFDDGALEVLGAKPNLRVLEDRERRLPLLGEKDVRQVTGGLLVQDRDQTTADRAGMEVVTGRPPTDDEWRDLLFAWQVCRHVKSNAIVLARDAATVGIGAGQMSRVDAVRLAVEKCRLEDMGNIAMASDAFFPFADGPSVAIAAGVTAIVQPGGSVRDDEVVAAADEAGVTMVVTGERHFRH